MAQNLAQAMKSGMRRLVAGVSVISARDDKGDVYAMTVSSVTSVSDQPPSLLVCINQSTRIAPVLVLGQSFAISVLNQSHQAVSICCSSADHSVERLKVGNWSLDTDLPSLNDAEAVFECQVDKLTPYGTHNIVIAKIVSVRFSEKDMNPLVYANGSYHKILPV